MRRLWLELGVLVALLVSFVTVPLLVPHVVTAIAWAALTAVHVMRRRRLYVGLLRFRWIGRTGSAPAGCDHDSIDRVRGDCDGVRVRAMGRLRSGAHSSSSTTSPHHSFV